MGHNDHWNDVRQQLPPEAGQDTKIGFEPDNDWLIAAEPEFRQEAMRSWFLTRFWDPANDTPYMTSEGGFLYIHGGPYDAEEQPYNRFGGLCSEEEIGAVRDDVESDGILEWAPIHHSTEYDEHFEYQATTRAGPYHSFLHRTQEADALADAPIDEYHQPMLRQLLYGSLIAAFEAYLADTMLYWVADDPTVFRRFVTGCEEFQKQKLMLSEIMDRMDSLQDDVNEYLQNLIWHRLDKIVPLMKTSLDVSTPSIESLMKHIIVRHDIVHRAGKTTDGQDVLVSADSLRSLRADVLTFVDALEVQLANRYPVPSVL